MRTEGGSSPARCGQQSCSPLKYDSCHGGVAEMKRAHKYINRGKQMHHKQHDEVKHNLKKQANSDCD